MFQFTQALKHVRDNNRNKRRKVHALPTYSRSSVPIEPIKFVSIGLLDPDEFKKLSVCEVTSHSLWTKDGPRVEGVYDPRLGPIDQNSLCSTCKGTIDTCSGHFGHISLPTPVYNVCYLNITLLVLKCVCFYCSRLLVDDNKKLAKIRKTKDPMARLKKLSELSKKYTQCGSATTVPDFRYVNVKDLQTTGCGQKQPTYNIQKLNINCTVGDVSIPFTPKTAYNILKRICDPVTIQLLGFTSPSHPKNMIFSTVFPVSPPITRLVTISNDEKRSRSESDTTRLLQDIVKFSNAYKKKAQALKTSIVQNDKESNKIELKEIFDKLQAHCAAYINNDIKGIPPITSHKKVALKSVTADWKKKQGHIRSHMNAKRVEYTARTVISPGVDLDIDQVGVPKYICQILTFPEKVNLINKAHLTKLVRRGPFNYPGATNIVKKDGTVVTLQYVNPKNITLELGDNVERHLVENDIVLMNRQPSLHKMSIMAHRVVPVDGKTFRLPLPTTVPYNADFDGDEMNLHVPQTAEARAEAATLLSVTSQITSNHCIGAVQDTLLAAYLLSTENVFISHEQFCYFLGQCKYLDHWLEKPIPHPAIYKPGPNAMEPKWTGKQLLSYLLPETVYVNLGTNSPEDILRNDVVMIREGYIACGAITKAVVGASSTSIIQQIALDCGAPYAAKFLSDFQRLCNTWLAEYGYGISLSDCINAQPQKTKEVLSRAVDFVSAFDYEDPEIKEQFVVDVLKKTREHVGYMVTENSGTANRMHQMIQSGAKGSNVNICQTKGTLGQVIVGGERIKNNYGNNRSLPHFLSNETNPIARGFVEHSFIEGLTPIETFFHAQGGREGLVDTASKTATTGYATRRVMRACEDVAVHQDRSVRDLDKIVAFLYGDDCLNPDYLETLINPLMNKSRDQIFKHFVPNRWTGTFSGCTEKEMDAFAREEAEVVCRNIQQLREVRLQIDCKNLDSRFKSPVHFDRLLTQIVQQQKHARSTTDSKKAELASAQYVKDRRRSFFVAVNTAIVHFCDMLGFFTLVRIYTSLKSIFVDRRLTKQSIDALFDTITHKTMRALIEPGTPVGSLQGHRVGEPTTQMTLNTFHLAGVGLQNLSLGIARFDEIIRVSTSISKPVVRFYMPITSTIADLEKLKASIIAKPLKHFLLSYHLLFEPEDQVAIPEDSHLVSMYRRFWPKTTKAGLSPIVIRLEFDRNRLGYHDVDLHDIVEKLRKNVKGKHDWIISPKIHDKWIVRLTLSAGKKDIKGSRSKRKRSNLLADAREVMHSLFQTKIVGIKGFTNVTYEKVPQISWNESTLELVQGEEYLISAFGTDMRAIMNLEDVDETRVTTNDIYQAQHVLDIEAAGKITFDELYSLFYHHGTEIDYHHLHTMVSSLIRRGKFVNMTRHGFNQDHDFGFIRRCSFEEMVKIIMNAAAFGEIDNLKGVTSNLVVGKHVPLGTRFSDVVTLEEEHVEANRSDVVMEELTEVDFMFLVPQMARIENDFISSHFVLAEKTKQKRMEMNTTWHVPCYDWAFPKKRPEDTTFSLDPAYSAPTLCFPAFYQPITYSPTMYKDVKETVAGSHFTNYKFILSSNRCIYNRRRT